MEGEIRKFKICTYKVNGLGNSMKRKDVFDFLREKKYNIYMLQETHLKTDQENFIRSAWGYSVYLAGSASNKNGVAILLNNNFEYTVHKVIRDVNGCYIILDVEIMKKRITLINVYGPSAGDQPDYFDNISRHIVEIGNDFVIAGGDFNVILNMNMDARNYATVSNKPKSRKKIHEIMEKHNLVDAYRELKKDERGYTWRKFKTDKQGRLDYFLVSEELMLTAIENKIGASYRSDHSIVEMIFRIDEFVRDRPFWKFNNSLLRDKKYVENIKETISKVKRQYALFVYNEENLDKVPNDQIQFQISDQLFFETLLLEIRGATINYASFKKKGRKAKRKGNRTKNT